jgi:hypothetical protein
LAVQSSSGLTMLDCVLPACLIAADRSQHAVMALTSVLRRVCAELVCARWCVAAKPVAPSRRT